MIALVLDSYWFCHLCIVCSQCITLVFDSYCTRNSFGYSVSLKEYYINLENIASNSFNPKKEKKNSFAWLRIHWINELKSQLINKILPKPHVGKNTINPCVYIWWWSFFVFLVILFYFWDSIIGSLK